MAHMDGRDYNYVVALPLNYLLTYYLGPSRV